MIILITSEGENLESRPCLRFGRTPFFIKYNLDDNSWEPIHNKATMESGGAGVAASQLLIDHQVSAALSGRFGPNAYRALSSAGIQMYTFDGSYQTVQNVIEGYINNQLKAVPVMDGH
jgi:predicted Fe-Mo cluster-binding NifX family protein